MLGGFPLALPTDAQVATALASVERFLDQKISLEDALVATMAREAGARVLTCDARHLTLLGSQIV